MLISTQFKLLSKKFLLKHTIYEYICKKSSIFFILKSNELVNRYFRITWTGPYSHVLDWEMTYKRKYPKRLILQRWLDYKENNYLAKGNKITKYS